MHADLHLDELYRSHTSPSARASCHHGRGHAGPFGAQRTACDSPISLVNATLDWIGHELSDKIDFVIWTGDSVRHELDPSHKHAGERRTRKEVVRSNALVAEKLRHVLAGLPIVPSLGNNDVLPHNTFKAGEDRWTATYLDIWDPFIPRSSRQSFARGAWFAVPVLPGYLTALSLNTLIFFNKNPEAHGCSHHGSQGYEQVQWLDQQLKDARSTGRKVIIIGHVPPGRTGRARYWTESCWQGYVSLLHAYRDLVIGNLFGHANVDHFLIQDLAQVNSKDARNGDSPPQEPRRYLDELRKTFHKLPVEPTCNIDIGGRTCQARHEKYHHKIGGELAERFAVTHVSPSIVPNYYPSLRVYEYNITGLVEGQKSADRSERSIDPGPAYFPQTLSLTAYKQYFANLTRINADYERGGNGTFGYQVLYDTRTDPVYSMSDLTARSYLKLAQRIGRGAKKRHERNAVWTAFLRRAFVAAYDDAELELS